MYTVYADGHLLYHPELANNGYGIYNPTINYEANKSGSFQFKMPVTNVMYNSLTKMSSIITVYQDSEEIFRGRVLNDDRDYYNNKSVYVEGELAFLLDSIVRPVEWNGTIANLFAHIINSHNEQVDASKRFTVGNCTVLADNEVTYSIIDYSNSWNVLNSYLMDIYGGYIRVRLENGTRYIDYIASYNSTSDQVIRFGDNLLDFNQHISGENVITRLIPLGAAYEIEKEDSEITPGTKIIDYESEPVGNKKKDNARTYIFAMEVLINSKNKSTEKTNVTISFKVKTEANTVSWSGQSASKLYAVIKTKTDKKTTERKKTGLASANWSTNFTTICTWTGDLKTGQTTITCEFVNNYSTKDNKPVSCGMSRYVDLLQQKSTRVDITSVNDGKDYIVNSQAEALFGQITGVQVWDDTDDPTALKTKGEEYLSENIALNVTLDVNAVDLNLVNVNYEKFKIGDRIRVVSAPHVLDEYFTCTAMSIDLQNPEQNTYTLGAEYKTLTETQIVNTNKLALTDEQINDIWEAVDEMNSIAEEANELIQTIYDNYADVTTVIENLDATYADIDFANITTAAVENLLATNAFIQALNAKYAQIDWANIDFAEIDSAKIQELLATTAAINSLSAAYAEIDLANVDMANIAQATIQSLFANTAFIQELRTRYAAIDFANIGTAAIENLTTNHLNAIYADVDFAHITEAAIQRLFAGTGLVNNLIIEEGHVTGTLAGVRITGDVIDANTIKADSLILQGDDGVYYKLNIDGLNNISTSEAAKFTLLTAKPADWETNWKDYYQITNNEYVHLTSNTAPTWAANRYYKLSATYESGLDGSNIVAQSVTANQIAAHTITANELNIASAKDGLGVTTLEADVGVIRGTVSSLSTTVDTAVESVVSTYGLGTSATSYSGVTFDQTTCPAREDGKYIWKKTVTTHIGGATQTVYEMIQGADGKDGEDGQPGAPGTSITISSIEYASSTSNTTAPTSGWQDTVPSVAQGSYLWTRTTYSDGSKAYTVARQGQNGSNGTSYYTWIRYSANSSGNPMSTTPNTYIGIYTGTSSTAPTSYTSYTWSKFEGTDGQPGSPGTSYYVWVRYSANSDGSGMTSTPQSNTKYIGVYSGTASTAPTSASSYSWTKYVGDNGTSVTVSNIKYASSTSGTTAPSSGWQDTVPSVAQGSYLWTRTTYSDGTNAYTASRQGVNGTNGTSITITSQEVKYATSSSGTTAPTSGWQDTVPSVSAGQYLWTRTTVNYSDSSSTVSYSVGRNGTNGTSVTISSKSIEYKKDTQGTTPPTSGWSTTFPTLTNGDYLWTRTTVTYSGSSGSTVSYSVSYIGTNGANGTNGKGISNIQYFYKTTTNQSAPSASSITGTTIPTLSATNKYLWQKQVITYTTGDPTTNVSLIAVYGDKGDTGVGVESVEPLYYLQDDGMNIVLNGNTKQTGKNLVDIYNNIPRSYNTISYIATGGIKVTNASAGTNHYSTILLSKGLLGKTVTISTTISVNGTNASASLRPYFVNNAGDAISLIGSSYTSGTGSKTLTVTIPSEIPSSATNIGLLVYSCTGTSAEAGVYATYDKLQVEIGSSATAYEPYFGTIPSPDYPVPIHSVSGDNTITVCGKNIAQLNPQTKVVNGVTITVGSDGLITAKGTGTAGGGRLNYFSNAIPLKTGTYKFKKFMVSGTSVVSPLLTNFSTGTLVGSGATSSGSTIIPSADVDVKIGFNVANGTVFDESFYLQLELGSTATEYESYTAQEYPITLPVENLVENSLVTSTPGSGISIVVDNGTIAFSGTATSTRWLKVCKKTLAEYGLSVGDTVTLSGCPQGGATDKYFMRGFLHDSNGADLYSYLIDTGSGGSLTLPSNTADIEVTIYVANGRNMDNLVFMPQLEKGSKANTYQPYGTTPIELNKIGSYADYFHNDGGTWYVHKEISTVDLGTLTWSMLSANNGNAFTAVISDAQKYNNSYITNILCTAYPEDTSQSNAYYIADKTCKFGGSYYGTSRITIVDSTYTDATTFKTSVDEVMLYYALATAEEIEVTDTTLLGQLNAISQAMSYNGVTNILQENNDLPFNIIYNEQAGIAPDAPTPPVTSTTNAPDVWTKFTPAHIDGYRYYTCLQTKYDDNTYSVSDVVPDQELNEVHAQLKYIETQVTENHSLFEVLDDRISSQVTEISTVKGQVQDLNGTISETERTLREEITSSSTQTAKSIRDEFTTRIETIEGDVSNIEEVTTFFEKSGEGLLIGKTNSDIRMELDNDSLDFINKNDEVMAKLDANEGLVAAKLAVGSPTEGNKRWQFIAWGTDNTHLRIAKHN